MPAYASLQVSSQIVNAKNGIKKQIVMKNRGEASKNTLEKTLTEKHNIFGSTNKNRNIPST